jgi:hypothetical protein
MPVNTITSDDTLTLYGRVIADLADGDTSAISFPDNLAEVKTGKDGNTVFAQNQKGKNATLTLRVMRGSSDDQFLQSQLALQEQNFPGVVLAFGSFVKRLGDGQGNILNDSYTFTAGVFTKQVEGKENVEGNTDQAVAIYNMKFAQAARGIK